MVGLKKTYTNRYGDEYEFILLEDGNVEWRGSFEYSRVGYPNDYNIAFTKYVSDGGKLDFDEFKKEIHRQIYDDDGVWISSCEVSQTYSPFVFSDDTVIDMVDPSGGPYFCKGLKVLGKQIKEFKPTSFGYLIITE